MRLALASLPLVALLVLGACAAGLAVPGARDAERARLRYPDASVASLQEGRAIYVSRCSGCHTLYLPARHAPDEWPPLLDEMAAEARLDGPQRRLVEQYLVTAAGEGSW